MRHIKRWEGVGVDTRTNPRLGVTDDGSIVVVTREITHNWFLYTRSTAKQEPLAKIKELGTWTLFGNLFPSAFQEEWLCRNVFQDSDTI